jgi:RHS repeat-associated protein
VRFLTDGAGTVTDTYDYDAFGNLVSQTGSTPNNYLYAGEQWDSDLGMYFLRARYLNVGTGRFWTQDSFEGDKYDPRSLHKYLYAGGNPINFVDPSGKTLTDTQIAFLGFAILATLTISLYYAHLVQRGLLRAPTFTFSDSAVAEPPDTVVDDEETPIPEPEPETEPETEPKPGPKPGPGTSGGPVQVPQPNNCDIYNKQGSIPYEVNGINHALRRHGKKQDGVGWFYNATYSTLFQLFNDGVAVSKGKWSYVLDKDGPSCKAYVRAGDLIGEGWDGKAKKHYPTNRYVLVAFPDKAILKTMFPK